MKRKMLVLLDREYISLLVSLLSLLLDGIILRRLILVLLT